VTASFLDCVDPCKVERIFRHVKFTDSCGAQLGFGQELRVLVLHKSKQASMMLFPHFLSLASLVTPNGQILLAGDNRQLAPIAAHDWEQEDRPPMQHYQPFISAYDAVLRIINDAGVAPASARQSACRRAPKLYGRATRVSECSARRLSVVRTLAGRDRTAWLGWEDSEIDH
jgi:hypothetical protein